MPLSYSWQMPTQTGLAVAEEEEPPEGDADWENRIANAIDSDRLNTADKLSASATLDATHWVLADGGQSHVTFDSTEYPPGSSGGSWKIAVLNDDGAASGNPGIYHGLNFTEGDTFWFSYRHRVDSIAAYTPWRATPGQSAGRWTAATNYSLGSLVSPTAANYNGRAYEVTTDGGSSGGTEPAWPVTINATVTDGGLTWTCRDTVATSAKTCISSNRLSSSVSNECVQLIAHNSNQFSGYHQNGSGFPGEDRGLSTDCSGSDVEWQPEINNADDDAIKPYPLTGTNPDTGSAWTACEQDRRQRSILYSARNTPAVNYRNGYGDPFSGGVREIPYTWPTITCRVEIGTFDVANSRYSMWVQPEGSTIAHLLFDSEDITLGSEANPLHEIHDTLWPIHYRTNGICGGRSVSTESAHIAGTTIHICGYLTPLGAGTLSFDSTTRRFTYTANGESAGSARGYSEVNDILIINVESSGSNSYLVVEVDPANLPGVGTGTYNNTVTIQQGRGDGTKHIADFIISGQMIPGPGNVPCLGVSELGDLAATMSSGDWADFTMGNLTDELVYSGTSVGVRSIIAYCSSSAVWDPIHKKIQFWGIGHGDQATPLVFPYLITYDATTNEWSKESAPPPTGGGHAYDHLAIDPTTGDLYHRDYNSNTINKKPYGAAWTTIASKSTGNNQVGGSLKWFQELNSGAGGLIFGDQGSMQKWNPATNTWSFIGAGFSPIIGHYGNLSAVAGGFCYVGGGAVPEGTAPRYAYRTNAAATSITQIEDFPHISGMSVESAALVAHPNGSGDLLLFENPSPGSANRIHQFNGTSWTEIDTHSIGKDNYFCTAIPEYGIVVFICQNNDASTADPNCRVYKP